MQLKDENLEPKEQELLFHERCLVNYEEDKDELKKLIAQTQALTDLAGEKL